jgi:peptidoglycan/xylan/chitin deacetylase (PgdA/CDA1 family)
MWRPPFYAVSPHIAAAASEAGYRTIGREIDPGDWMNREDARHIGIRQLSAADMIDRIMDTVRNGSIIPIRLGTLPGGRDDYLFNSLDLLLDALIRSGYEIVPVSRL